ncbi:hypothetical protein PCE1_003961 [Barthelona sp. PCE]
MQTTVQGNEQKAAEQEKELQKIEQSTSNTEFGNNIISVESDSDDDAPTNTVGAVPTEWYQDYEHIGYDISGKPIQRPPQRDDIQKFLDIQSGKAFRLVRDEVEQKDVELSRDDIDFLKRAQKGQYPKGFKESEYNFDLLGDKMVTSLSRAPLSKRSFEKGRSEYHETKRIMKAMKDGRFFLPEPTRPPQYDEILIWDDTKPNPRTRKILPAPKPPLPDTHESYNPPDEYLPTPEELEKWKYLDPDKRPLNFIPRRYTSLLDVPMYLPFIEERYQRCLDLYLCTRVKRRVLPNLVEELMPDLPKPSQLRPFPLRLAHPIAKHEALVRTVSFHSSGKYVATADNEGTFMVSCVRSGRQLFVTSFDEAIAHIEWNPLGDLFMIGVAHGKTVSLIKPTVGYSSLETNPELFKGAKLNSTWSIDDEDDIVVEITHRAPVKQIRWHYKGDYLAVLLHKVNKNPVVFHHLSSGRSQNPFDKIPGMLEAIAFHPSRPEFFVANRQHVYHFDLEQQRVIRKLKTGCTWISDINVHPSGAQLLVSTFDKQVQWFEIDIQVLPYKSLRQHKKPVRGAQFHPQYPLFSSCDDSGIIQVFHGKVFNDGIKNSLIVPVKVLKTPENSPCTCLSWHPIQPWVAVGAADGCCYLFTH